jgi:hypothetical protein
MFSSYDRTRTVGLWSLLKLPYQLGTSRRMTPVGMSRCEPRRPFPEGSVRLPSRRALSQFRDVVVHGEKDSRIKSAEKANEQEVSWEARTENRSGIRCVWTPFEGTLRSKVGSDGMMVVFLFRRFCPKKPYDHVNVLRDCRRRQRCNEPV